jgi:putative tryptophan/tyrosine transport system substrate-binding protein
MRRREFIALAGGVTLASPCAAQSRPSTPTVGFLGSAPAQLYGSRIRAFREGLEGTGFVEGRDVSIEYRFAGDQLDRLSAQAGELVQHPVNVLATSGIPASLAAKAATATIPIVFYGAGDPVKLGLVSRLNQPGGNLTGVTTLGGELSAKRLELARELVPNTSAIAFLVNPGNPNTDALIEDAQAAARSLGLQVHVLRATRESEIDTRFADLARLQAGAMVIGNDGLFASRAEELAALGLRHAVPSVFQTREFAAAGGLVSYGAEIADAYRQLGLYAGRILKGEKPAEMPVQQSAKVELIINLRTAKALGLTVPLSLLGRADEVIE